MWKTIEKLAVLFCLIVFLTFMLNHGHLDFSGIDWVRNRTTEAINSEQGQEYIEETKDISRSVFHDLFYGIKEFITGEDSGELTGKKDSSVFTSPSTKSPDESSELDAAKLLYVYDGDTIEVDLDGEEVTIRMIGIDTPESVNPDASKNNEYGDKASAYTKTFLENISTVYLEYDVSDTDTYGRTLAYVWLSDDTSDPQNNMVNAILVRDGYAKDVVYMPNNKYSSLFFELCDNARNSNTGLWKYEGFEQLWD